MLFNVCVWFTCVGVGVLSVDFLGIYMCESVSKAYIYIYMGGCVCVCVCVCV